MTRFQQHVLHTVSRVPKGRVTTYRLLARAIGRPGAIRAVGNALHKNPHLVSIPCHRVIKSSGEIGGYAGGSLKKQLLLQQEGIQFDARNRVNTLPAILFQF